MNLQAFNNKQFGELRVLQNEKETWIIAKDVCNALGLKNVSQALSSVDDDDKSSINPNIINYDIGLSNVFNKNTIGFDIKTVIPESRNGGKKLLLINESGFYTLVLRSNMPQAKQFRKWVTSEVLPSIRKHGGYLTPEKLEEVLLSPDTIMKLAQNLKAEQERRIEAENRAASLEEDVAYQAKELKEAGPKVEYYEQVMNSKSLINTTIIAKDLGMSATKLNKILHQLGVIYKIGGTWVLYSQYDNKGYTGSVTKTVSDRHGVVHTIVHNLWTQKGRKFIYDFLAYHQVISMNTHTTLLRGLPKE